MSSYFKPLLTHHLHCDEFWNTLDHYKEYSSVIRASPFQELWNTCKSADKYIPRIKNMRNNTIYTCSQDQESNWIIKQVFESLLTIDLQSVICSQMQCPIALCSQVQIIYVDISRSLPTWTFFYMHIFSMLHFSFTSDWGFLMEILFPNNTVDQRVTTCRKWRQK